LTTADLTVARVHRFSQYKEAEEDYNMVIKVLKLERLEKIMDFIDDWPKYLALYDGKKSRSFDYIIRASVMVPAETTDTSFGEPGSLYVSLRDEITARADHQAPPYRADNARVFELLNESVTEYKHVKTWIKPYAKLRDGCGAWLAFKAHYRGNSELEAIETTAENQLDTLVYRCGKPCYNFETVSMHQSLQASTMAIPVGMFKAIEDLCTDFDVRVNYSRAFISSSNEPEVRNVAGLERSKTGKKYQSKKRNNNKKVTGGPSQGKRKALRRYNKPDEWWKLDQQTREKNLQIRKKRNISEVSSSRRFRWKEP
jgi:hypothetical protein